MIYFTLLPFPLSSPPLFHLALLLSLLPLPIYLLSLSDTACAQENVWRLLPPMSRPRSAAGVAVFENDIYVSGGHDGLQIFYSVEKSNPATNQWASVPPMLEKRYVCDSALLCPSSYK